MRAGQPIPRLDVSLPSATPGTLRAVSKPEQTVTSRPLTMPQWLGCGSTRLDHPTKRLVQRSGRPGAAGPVDPLLTPATHP